MEISSPQEMNAAPLRFCCLVPGCRANKDFSLITLFEHLNYHVKDKNLTSFFEYKCLSCPAFFTNKIFMFDHKRCYPHHRIEHIPCLDLDTPNNDPQLCEAFNLITASYLRHMFAVSGQNGAISRNFHQTEPPKTPTYSRDGYEPRTPFYNDFRQRDFSNSCVNANLPRAPSAPQGNELAAKNFANQLDGIMLSSIPEDWKQAIVSQMVPFLNGSNPFSQEADVGRGTRARDNMDSGGRDSFGSRDGPPRSGGNFNDRFETNGGGGSSDRPRGSGRGGDSDRPRGCFNRGKEGHHVSDCPDPRKPRFGADGDGFSSRGDGRGRGGDRHSSRGRGGDRGGGRRGGFRGGRSGGADRNRSRSRSPRRSSPPARRSYSRSHSPPSNRSDAKRKSLSRDRSFSRSPQSD